MNTNATGSRAAKLLLAATLGLILTVTGFPQGAQDRIRVILDTDANNELDDQHAIAYLLFNGGAFDVEGVTVNRTRNGGDVSQHYAEAERVVRLCNLHPAIKVYTGANGSFEEIRQDLDKTDYDGAEAVEFILDRARAQTEGKLVLLPVGKLTNIALALEKDPSIAERVRIVWLGSNYPEPGEYNQVNDEEALRYLLERKVSLEIALVRYGKPSGTDAVRATLEEVSRIMPGCGPQVEAVVGRHGKAFRCFGDYSLNLFQNIELHGNPPSRALFDMAAVAVVKNPTWAKPRTMPAPLLLPDGKWQDRPDNSRKIILWEDFDRGAIMNDFYATMRHYQLAQ